MGLPIGFQARQCPFCGGRQIMNCPIQKDGKDQFRATCIFCGSEGPACQMVDDAWLAWNGQHVRCPAPNMGVMEVGL